MNDILFYNNYVAAGDIITITLSIVIFALLRSTYAVRKKNLDVFQKGLFFLVVAACSSIIYHRMVLNVTAENVIGIYMMRAVSYSALFWTYVCFLAYIRNLVGMRPSYRKVFYFSIHGAAVVGTGRSDYANQVNNLLAFPGVFRGALDARASKITHEMKKAAAVAIADSLEGGSMRADYVIPTIFDRSVGENVARAVAQAWKDE